MSTTIVPVRLEALPYFQQSVSLEGQSYLLTHRWNSREKFHFIDLLNNDGSPIIKGIKLVPNYAILAKNDLTEDGLTGFFILMSKTDKPMEIAQPSDVSQYYVLAYFYETPEEE